MTEEKTVVHIVPSAHWDREWYLPFRRFQPRLVRMLQKAMRLTDDADYVSYLLDGQSILLEDYLEICPADAARLRQKVETGRLVPGPWYTVPDTAIPCGESLVQNLAIGRAVSAAFGGGQPVGYSPDSFGLCSQLPQLYRQFGYQYAMFSRGLRLQPQPPVFHWQAPDGSTVLAVQDAYSAGLGLVAASVWHSFDRHGQTPAGRIQAFANVMAMQDARGCGKTRLLLVGIDHFEPVQDLSSALEELRRAFPQYDIRHSTLAAYFAALAAENTACPVAVGEQRGPYNEHFVLGNTLSARPDIKQKNRHVENALIYHCQPLYAFTPPVSGFDGLEAGPLMDKAWRLLTASHAHDSICGCNVDETNADVLRRITEAYDLAREVQKLQENILGSGIRPGASAAALVVYNPLPVCRSGWVQGQAAVPCQVRACRLVRADGTPVEGAHIRQTFQKRRDIETMKKDEYAEILADTTRVPLGDMGPADYYTGVEYAFYAADVPAGGYAAYYLVEDAGQAAGTAGTYGGAASPAAPPVIENEYYRVKACADGRLDITLKSTGETFTGLHWLEDDADEGDSYTYSPTGDHMDTRGMPADITVGADALGGWLSIAHTWRRPNGGVRACTMLRLPPHAAVLEFETTVTNAAQNHRLRAVFAWPQLCDESLADSAFDLVRRPIFDRHPEDLTEIWTHPMRNVVCLPAKRSLTVYSRGPQEYEAYRLHKETYLALTLLRSVDKVYRTDCLTRDETGCGAGVRWPTKDSRMLGSYTFCYGLQIDATPLSANPVLHAAQSWQAPLTVFGAHTTGTAAPRQGFLQVEGAVYSTAWTDGPDKQTLYLRVYNADAQQSRCRVTLAAGCRAADKVDLAGRLIQPVTVEAGTAVLSLGAGEIATLRIQTAR